MMSKIAQPQQSSATRSSRTARSARAARVRRWLRLAVEHHQLVSGSAAGILLGLGFMLHRILVTEGTPLETTGRIMVWAALGIGLVYGGRAAWVAVREFEPDIDVLMVVGAILAAALGHPDEGALLMFLFVLSGGLEDLAMRRTNAAITALHELIPDQTLVRRGGDWIEAQPEELAISDVVLIRPGEKVPADGIVVEGITEFDQASLTGEPLPRSVELGDTVFEGTINQGHPVEIRVTRTAAESSLHRVLALVTEAQERRQPVQQMIDRLSKPYTVTVFAVSLIAFLVYWLALGRTLDSAAFTAITLLIVASPCALVIATPTATLAAISRGARAGVLFKGGDAIERLARTRAVALDKTGTLTHGCPHLTEVQAVGWSDTDHVLALAAGLEHGSTHPIASAILAEADRRNIEPAECARLESHPGKGVAGVWNSEPIRLGRYPYVADHIPICLRSRVRELMGRIQARGEMAVALAWADQAAVFSMADTARPGAREMVEDLRRLGIHPITMLTGDIRDAAQRLSEKLGLDSFHGECLPEDKLEIVHNMRKDHGAVAVIGDGVNDAPSLAASDVGIAVGGIGSDAALETADIILLNEDLRSIPWAIGLARAARRTVALNLGFAMIAIAALAVATMLGYVNLALGVVGHEGGTLLVVANGLRLLLYRGPSVSAQTSPERMPAHPEATRFIAPHPSEAVQLQPVGPPGCATGGSPASAPNHPEAQAKVKSAP